MATKWKRIEKSEQLMSKRDAYYMRMMSLNYPPHCFVTRLQVSTVYAIERSFRHFKLDGFPRENSQLAAKRKLQAKIVSKIASKFHLPSSFDFFEERKNSKEFRF